MQVALFEGSGLVSWLIRAQTRGKISHSAIVDDDGSIYESVSKGGARKRDGPLEPDAHLFQIIGITEAQKERVREYCLRHIARKTPYDYWGVARFVTRSRKGWETPGEESSLFCSEMTYNALGYALFWLFSHPYGHLVHPSDLSWSTRLRGPLVAMNGRLDKRKVNTLYLPS